MMLRKNRLYFQSCIKIKNDIWFSALNYNGLYRYNLIKKTCKRIADFPNEEMWTECLHYIVRLYEHFLIFIPHVAKKISIFDIEQEKFHQIEIPYLGEEFDVDGRFVEGIVYKEQLYAIGCHYPGIVKVDLKTYKTEVIYREATTQKTCDGIYFGTEVVIEKNYMYVPVFYENAILLYDMDYDKVSKLKIGKDSNRYVRIIRDDSHFYLATCASDCIVIWDKENNTCHEIETNFRKAYHDTFICFNEKYIWVISMVSNEIYRIDKMTEEICYFDLEGDSKKDFNITYVVTYDEGICFFDTNTCSWYYFNDDGILQDLGFNIEEPRNIEEIWTGFNQKYSSFYMSESKRFPLEYLFFRVRESDSVISKDVEDSSIGKAIWQKLD